MKKLLISLLSIFALSRADAKITLTPLFSDNMILQQETQAPIWGSSDKSKATISITTSWDNKTTKTKANDNGDWRLEVETPTYGGPYTITISDGEEVTLSNVLIGEVWIASGQSNMEMMMTGFNSQPVEGANHDIATSRDPQLRVMDVEHAVSDTPLSTITSLGWSEANSEVVAPMSATAYYFGRTLRTSLDIPIGILVSSWGGTSINSWTCPEDANSYIDVQQREKKSSPRSQHYPGGLYNGMINPIIGFAARGFIWYQGESDRMRPDTYCQKLSDLASKWREEWGNEEMPFYYAQIAPFEYTRYAQTDTISMYMREEMSKAVDIIPNSGMVCLSDAGLQDCIHPSNKRVVGERFAYQALVKTYGLKGIVADGPRFKSAEIKDNTIVITFDNAEIGLSTFGEEIRDFEISGEDGIFVEASARIRSNTVILSSKAVPEPTKARYGFKNWFKGNLYNLGGIPASSFKTFE
ncbi:MAG: sialate O-acetylesterase [Rikenellaceae bacterium]